MKEYKNPIILNSPKGNTSDPYVIRHGGYYYHCYSNREGIFIAKSKTLWDIEKGEITKVYDCTAPNSLPHWYAPELHLIGNKWYIYAAPDYGNDLHVVTVLESTDSSPIGEYKNLGMIRGLENKWTIDATVLSYQNELYLVFTTCAEIFISKMADPQTITGKITGLTKPTYEFETRAGLINEGPAVLYRGDKIHVVYSANNSMNDEYCLGLLTFKKGGDILDIQNWEKSQNAVFEKTEDIFGPGHCSFTTVTENGKETDYIVYHANLESGSGWHGRNVFIKPFGWDENDAPVFGRPEF